MNKTKIICFCVIFLGFLGFEGGAEAATYYVDQNHESASDSNPGTEELPWLTLKKATNTAQKGYTVLVKEGIYIDDSGDAYSKFNPVNSGTLENPIIFRSVPRYSAIIRSPALPSNTSYAWYVANRAYIVIDGFKLEGGVRFQSNFHSSIKNSDISIGHCPSDDPTLNWGLVLYSSRYCTLENNYVHDIADSGSHDNNTAAIMVFGGIDTGPSEDNIIQNNLADAGNGVVYSAFGQKAGNIRQNIWRYNIAQNAPTGFLGMGATAGTVASEDNIYYQNIAINCERAFALNHMCYRFKFYNNTAYNCSKFLSGGNNSNKDIQLWNNIMWGNTTAIWWGGYPNALPFSSLINYSDYNDFYGYSVIGYREKEPTLTYTTLSGWQTATGFDVNSINSDPLFVNSTNRDFHLQTNSSCLNAGIDRQDYDDDTDTTESINMGAYITGNEIIGPNTETPPDVVPPSVPTDLTVN